MLRLVLRSLAILLPLAVLLLLDRTVTLWMESRIGRDAVVAESVVAAVLGSGLFLFALWRYGGVLRQAMRLYRTCGFVYSQDHVVEFSLVRAARLFVASVALVIPGIASDTLGILILFIPPVGWLIAQAILDVVLPGAFETADDVW
jgi:UPF0716 family protein affecting phage T7 exclusion